MTRIAIHPDRIGTESYSDRWTEALRRMGAEPVEIDLLAPDAVERLRACDGVMCRWIHAPQDKQSLKRILYVAEQVLGIPVFPDTRSAWHFDEKVAQHYLFAALDVPAPRAWLFWKREQALAWAVRDASYPVVFKLSSGAGSANVLRIDDSASACGLIDRMFGRGMFPYTLNEFRHHRSILRRVVDGVRYVVSGAYPTLHPVFWKPEQGYAYFQEFLPGNESDTRVTVIGDRAFAFRRRVREGDFRASGSGRIDHDPLGIDERCLRLAFELSRRGGFQSMAYDFLFRDGEPVVVEISYAFADRAVYDCPGHWDSALCWVEGHLWPEEAQVEDFLASITRRGARSSSP